MLDARAVESLDASAAAFVANQQDQTLLPQHTPSRSLPKETQLFENIKRCSFDRAKPVRFRHALGSAIAAMPSFAELFQGTESFGGA